MKIMIFRLSDTEISVDGIIFMKVKSGNYIAEREEFRELNVFRSIIEDFLKVEQVAIKKRFDARLTAMLLECGIDQPGHHKNN